MKIRMQQVVTKDFGEIEIDDNELDGLTIEEYLDENIDEMISGNTDYDQNIQSKVQYRKGNGWVDFPS